MTTDGPARNTYNAYNVLGLLINYKAPKREVLFPMKEICEQNYFQGNITIFDTLHLSQSTLLLPSFSYTCLLTVVTNTL